MNLNSISKAACFTGLACLPVVFFFSFAGTYWLGPVFVLPQLIIAVASLVFFLLATLVLWIADCIILARTWSTRHALLNCSAVLFLVFGNCFAAYVLYFVFRKDSVYKPSMEVA